MLRLVPLLAFAAAPLCLANPAEPSPAPLPSPSPAPVVELDPLAVTATAPDTASPGIPAAVDTHDGDFLSQNHIATAADLAPYVPGFFASEQAVTSPSYNIRGVGSDSADPRAEERVAVYQDGVPIGRTTGASVALFDLDRADVFKGPQPSRFLRGAQAGAISLVSQPAENTRSARFTGSAGDHDARTFEGVVNSPLVPDRLFGRVAVLASHRDGVVDNLAPGAGDLQGVDTAALRTSLRWQASERSSLDVVFNHQRDTPPGVAFKSMVVPTRTGDADPYSAADLNRGDQLGIDRDIQSLAATLRAELTDAWRLTSVSAGRRFDSREEYDADGSRFYLLELGHFQKDRQLSQELRLDYDAGEKLSASLGAGLFWQEGEQTTVVRSDERRAWALLSDDFRQGLVDAGVPPPFPTTLVPELDPFAPDASLPDSLPAEFAGFAHPAFAGTPLASLAALAGAPLGGVREERTHVDTETAAAELFGESSLKVTDRLRLGGALRLTQERISSAYEVPDTGTGRLGFLLGGGGNDAFRPTPGRLAQSDRELGWSGRADARYAVTDKLDAFTAVSRGRRAPMLGFDQRTLEAVRLDEEILWNYEAGLRGRAAGDRVAWSASVFQFYYEGFQTEAITAPGVVSLVDGGRARGRGFEISARGAVAENLALFGSYGFTDARFSALDEDGRPQAYAGDTFRLASRHAASLGATLALPAPRGAFHLSPVFQYRSAAYFADDNDSFGGRLRQGGYGVLNLELAYRPRRGFWEAAVFAENALDREYLVDAGNAGAAFGLPTTVRGNPRLLGARFTARF